MASKKDKEKIDSKALALKPKSNITTSLFSLVTLTNRFSTFSPTSPISYSNTLASPYDPFVDSSQKSRVPYINYDKPFAYMAVPYFQHLFSIETNWSQIKSPNELTLTYFPPNFHWISKHPLKTLAFYSNILIQTKSIHFKPIHCKTSNRLLFHSVYIDKIILEKDWWDHPFSPRVLANFDIPYCYFDYIEAWSRFFLYQTPKFGHSWFINFDRNNFGRILPHWFSGGGCILGSF